VSVTVTGLRGGHSGADIHECRGNANKLLARLLGGAAFPVRLISFAGGNKHNAIPREARAELLVASGDVAKLMALVDGFLAEARKLLAEIDDGIQITVADAKSAAALSAEQSRQIIDLVCSLPDGVLGMSRAIKGLVETSNNVAVVATETAGASATFKIVASSRSSSAPHLTAVMEQVAGAARLAGCQAAPSDGYPGWQPNPKSKLLKVCEPIYEKLFAEKPRVTAIHAGLECGVIGERVGGMDMISFGPTIKGAHSPDERVSISSVEKFWKYFSSVLQALASA
jgi:dipeptidase D